LKEKRREKDTETKSVLPIFLNSYDRGEQKRKKRKSSPGPYGDGISLIASLTAHGGKQTKKKGATVVQGRLSLCGFAGGQSRNGKKGKKGGGVNKGAPTTQLPALRTYGARSSTPSRGGRKKE